MRQLLSVLLSVLLCFSLSSCADTFEAEEDSNDFWNDTADTEDAEDDDRDYAARNSFALPYLSALTLDPITCADGIQRSVGALLYEPLFTLDEHFAPHGVLCSEYSCDPDMLTYFFTLHENVRFSDGSVLTAADVAATCQRAQSSARYSSRLACISSVRVTGDLSLSITLRSPNSAFPALLDIPIVKDGTQNELVPLGTGPFLFFSDSEGTSLRLNTLWWQKKALPLDSVTLVPVKDSDTAMHLFSDGTVPFLVTDLTGVDSAPVLGDVAQFDIPTTDLQYLCFNTEKSFLSDAKVRRAISQRIDRSEIAEVYLIGHASAADCPISPNANVFPSLEEKRISQDAYRDVMTEVQHPDTVTILINEGNAFRRNVAQALCDMLSTEGLTFSVRSLPWNDYLNALSVGDFDLCYCEVRLTADWNSASLIGSYGSLNYGRFSDFKLDSLLSAFLAEETTETAAAFCSRFAELSPIAPLAFHSDTVLSPCGFIGQMSSTVSNVFSGIENWSFHISADEAPLSK